MMRGAVSVAMVYYRFDPKNHNEDSHSATIVVTTLQVVLYSTVFMGGVTGPLLQYLLPQQACDLLYLCVRNTGPCAYTPLQTICFKASFLSCRACKLVGNATLQQRSSTDFVIHCSGALSCTLSVIRPILNLRVYEYCLSQRVCTQQVWGFTVCCPF